MNEFARHLLVIGMRKGEREYATMQQFNVRRRDLLVNADAICQLASKLRALDGLPLLPKENQAEAFSITVCEVEYLTAIIGTRHAQIVCHPVMRSRIEYLLCCLHALLPYEREAGQLDKLLLGMFRLFKVVLSQGKSSSAAWSEEDDILSVSNTVRTWSASVSAKDVDSQSDISSAIPGRSSWLDICLASVASFIVEVLRRDPRLLASLPVSTSEALALASSPRWQVQYLGMGICCASTSAELQDMQQRLAAAGSSKRASAPSSHKLVASGSEKTIKAPAAVSSRRRSMGGAGPLTRSSSSAPSSSSSSLANKATPETVLTLSRNGGLRAMLWCLLHKHWAVRVLALQFLRNLLDIAECLRSYQQGIVEEIWAACAEQGLVVLLETVAQGLPVLGSDHSGQSMRFPEMEVRQCATLLLDVMAAGLAGSHGGLARHRLVSALSYSAGDGLRKNSLLSVLYLCGRSPALSQHLFSPHTGLSRSMVASLAQPACIVLQEIFMQDAASVASLLQMLMLFVNGAESWFQVAQRASVNEVATQAGHRRMSPKDTPLLWPNFVRIRRRDGREVRMTCPPLSLIAAQCPALAGRMEISQQRQHEYVIEAHSALALSSADLLTKALMGAPDLLFEELEGDYDIWQEVFSHLADSYLMRKSVASMSDAQVVQCLELAQRYEMTSVLLRGYCDALAQRLSNAQSLLQAFRAAGSNSANSKLHLPLYRHCLVYLSHHSTLLVENSTNASKEFQVLWQCLQALIASV